MAASLASGAVTPAHAAVILPAPPAVQIDPVNGFPMSFSDGSIALAPCLSGPQCLAVLPTPAAPVSFPGNFPDEQFYFAADASQGNLRIYRAGLEATFTGAPAVVDGQQMGFSRLRFRVENLVTGASYTIQHPYGTRTFTATHDPASTDPTVGLINETFDEGVCAPAPGAPCNWVGVGAAFLGDFKAGATPFVTQSNPLLGRIGDIGVPGTIGGAPSGTNAVIITGPKAGGPAINTLTVDQFTVQGLIAGPPVAPSAPLAPTATAGISSALVRWQAPANGGSPVTAYSVQAVNATTGALVGLPQPATPATGTSANSLNMTGLANGTAVTFKVQATNAAGTGLDSAASNAVTPATVPGSPVMGTAKAGDTSAIVTWTAPLTDGGSAVIGYTVTASPGGRTATTTGATTATVTGLANLTAHTFTVAAINTAGTGAVSAPSAAVIPGTQVQRYIGQVYSDLFNRAPDPAGMAGWTTKINNGTPRIGVANGITFSTEYRSKLIAGSYDRYLKRGTDPTGLSGWLAAMGRGITVSQMEAGFIASNEYFTKGGNTNEGWVNKLYTDVLARPAGPAEVSAWTARMRAGESRRQVAMGFLLSKERLGTVVDGHYRHLLGRGLDPNGRLSTVTFLGRGGRDEAIIGGIISSTEYFGRV